MSVSNESGEGTRESMFGHLARRFVAQREDLATEALTWILNRSEPAAHWLTQVAGDLGMGATSGPLRFATQHVVPEDTARPDLVGLAVDGGCPLIIEVKFWAELTPNQPVTYLDRLPPGGLLLFIVPEARLPTLWPTLRRLAEVPPLPGEDPGTMAVSLPGDRRMAAISWLGLLGGLRSTLERHGEQASINDLDQLAGLVAQNERDAFHPLTQGDLTSTLPRRVRDYLEVVDDLAAFLLKERDENNEKIANKNRLRKASGPGWSGHYIQVHGWVCLLHFSTSKWRRVADTPFWLTIHGKHHLVEPVVAPLRDPGSEPRYYLDRGHHEIALFPPLGEERSEVLAALREQVMAVAALLAAHPPSAADSALDIESLGDDEAGVEGEPEEVEAP